MGRRPMKITDRAYLDSVPIPTDAAGLPALCCAIGEHGQWRTAWLIGSGKHAFGPAYPNARAVAAAAHYINERETFDASA